MKRIVCLAALIAIVAVVGPAVGDTDANGCTATQAVTVSPIIGDTSPTCSFEVTCSGATTVCVYVWSLDANGTGLVSAAMEAAVVSPAGGLQWAHADGSGEAPAPSCSGAFQCHAAFGVDNDVLLFVDPQGEGAAVRVTCSAGDIAAVASVGCGLAAIEFNPAG